MHSLRLDMSVDQGLLASDLPLRIPRASGVIDPEPFRHRSVHGPALAEAFERSGGLRSLHLPQGARSPALGLDAPLLTFVISGELSVATRNQGTLSLRPGDLALTSDASTWQQIAPMGDCRLLQVIVEEDWPGAKVRPVEQLSTHPRGTRDCNFKRMVKSDDNRSYFYGFPEIFGAPGNWSALTPLVGLRFIDMAEDTFIDWHPEIVNNLVIVLSGALELEVGGGTNRIEVFREGDICLAQDRTGEGHIDRMHGHVTVAVLIVEDSELWPLTQPNDA